MCALVPSADAVRFTSSGGEATQLGLRVARAATGRDTIVKFQHHFHGWHDAVAAGITPPWDAPYAPGIPAAVRECTRIIPCNDVTALDAALSRDPRPGVVIIEPGGGYSDTVPVDPSYLQYLREATRAAGTVLIFDEVITGFRYAPGGVQEYTGVLPDLTTLGKVVSGGLPGGALAGRADLLDYSGALRTLTGHDGIESRSTERGMRCLLLQQQGLQRWNSLAQASRSLSRRLVPRTSFARG